ncbi:MAG: UDP-N-acetylmuramate--L-alanine ligase [Armatimonadota bacterium]
MNRPNIPAGTRVHMVGIGGAGMSALAVVLAGLGYPVSGSDMRESEVTRRLASLGIEVRIGHRAENASGAGLVVVTAAAPSDNPEIVAARSAGVSIITRAEMLGLLVGANYGIAVAGTHGKTTTTSMLALVLEAAGMDATLLVGGDLAQFSGNAKLGGGELLLTEACEAFNSFLALSPAMAVVTNIDADHLDCHGSLDGVVESFRKFLSQIKEGGCAVVNADCPNARSVIPSIGKRVVTFGFREGDYLAQEVDVSTPEPRFRVNGLEYALRVPGEHNAQNALAAIAAASELGVAGETIRDALLEFRGAGRRFEVLGTARGITVIDDYAHHPTEVRATLAAARAWGRRVVAVFQPHLFSRTRDFAAEFAESLGGADVAVVAGIYAAREKPIPGVTGAMIADLAQSARFVPEMDEIPGTLIPELRDGDLVVIMGAGDIRRVAEDLLRRLQGDLKTIS